MSWLFGIRNNQPPMGGPNAPAPPEPMDSLEDVQKKIQSGKMEAYRFDSSALERAAAAAKNLENSSKRYLNTMKFSDFFL